MGQIVSFHAVLQTTFTFCRGGGESENHGAARASDSQNSVNLHILIQSVAAPPAAYQPHFRQGYKVLRARTVVSAEMVKQVQVCTGVAQL